MIGRRRLPRLGMLVGSALVLALLVVAALEPVFLPAATALGSSANAAPSAEHLLGTDGLGRDVLARTLAATRLSLLMTAGAAAISVGGGVLLGVLIWAMPSRVRDVGIRLVDAAVAYPSLITALIVAAILGPGSTSAVLAIGLANLPAFARVTSNLAASVSRQGYLTASSLLGVGRFRLLLRHMIPNVAESLLVLTASNVASNLVELSSLSFVGLGVQSPEFDFGRLLSDGLSLIYVQPWAALAPSFMITVSGVAFVLIGDGLATGMQHRRGLAPPVRGLRAARPASRAAAGVALPADGELVVEDLVVRRADGTALVDGVGLRIGRGEIVGLVGESGSGKSLTAMSIAGLLPDGLTREAATLRLGELDLTRPQRPATLATTIGLIYQDPGTTFNPAIRLGAQLTEVARVHGGMPRRAATEAMIERLAEVSIVEPRARMRAHPSQLSGGMLQRALIASATASSPALLIADEPTTALDVTVQAEVLRLLRRVNRQDGTSVLFISHDIEVVGALCDRVLVMREGRILEELTGAQLAAGDVRDPYTEALLAASPANLTRGPRRTRGDRG